MTRAFIGITSVAMALSLATATQAGTLASAARQGLPVAYARMTTGGVLQAFGGKGTSAATSSGNAFQKDVVFTGRYPQDITPSKVILQSTVQSSYYGVSNADVVSASPTEIRVRVYSWRSDIISSSGVSGDTFVTVLVGK